MNLELKNVSKYYGSRKALDQINWNITPGKIIGLLGPNGCGKTTLIKLVNRLIPISSGSILADGFPLGIQSQKKIAYLPERTFLDSNKKVSYYLQLFQDFFEDFQMEKAVSQLRKFHIDPNNKIATLSKGMREKVQLILIMSRNAEIYILDEPISGVDPVSREVILEIILSNFSPQSTLILSTHLIQDVERILDEVIFMYQGKIILHEEIETFKKKYHGSVNEGFREVFGNVFKGI